MTIARTVWAARQNSAGHLPIFGSPQRNFASISPSAPKRPFLPQKAEFTLLGKEIAPETFEKRYFSGRSDAGVSLLALESRSR